MPRRLPPDCVEDRDRHGNIRIYYRAKGKPKVRLRGTPWSQNFMAQLGQRQSRDGAVDARTELRSGTWRWLCTKYFVECSDYLRLDERTKRVRRGIIETTFDEPIAARLGQVLPRHAAWASMTEDAVEVLRDRKIQTPEAANARLKAIRQVFKFGVKKKLAPRNTARDVEYFRSGSSGFHTWTTEEVRQFEARHPVGTKARLALALMLFTGQRRSDIIRFGKQHAKAASSLSPNTRVATENPSGSRCLSSRLAENHGCHALR